MLAASAFTPDPITTTSPGHRRPPYWRAPEAVTTIPNVSDNDTQQTNNTAAEDTSLNPTPPPPSNFNPTVVDTSNTCNQDGPSIRQAVHLDGMVYVVFSRWTSACDTADIVIVRDDDWGTGPSPYQALKDSITHTVGQRVAIDTALFYLEKAADRIEDVTEHHHPVAAVERAHQDYLVKVADAAN
jgi:hypothetical protein